MLLLLFRSRRIDVRSHWGFLREREREFRGLSSIFGAARKYGSGWIGQVILIGWKCSATLTVKLNYVPNKNISFFLLHTYTIFNTCYYKSIQWVVLTFLPHLRSYQFLVHKIRSPFLKVYLLPHGVRARVQKYTSSLLERLVKKVDYVVSPRGDNSWVFWVSQRRRVPI